MEDGAVQVTKFELTLFIIETISPFNLKVKSRSIAKEINETYTNKMAIKSHNW